MSHQRWDRHFYCHNTIISNWIDWQSTDPTLQSLQPTFWKFDHQLTSNVFNGLVDSANQDKKWRFHGLTRRPIPNATLLLHISNFQRTPHSFLIFLGLVALWLEIRRGPRGFRKKKSSDVVRLISILPYPDSLPNRSSDSKAAGTKRPNFTSLNLELTKVGLLATHSWTMHLPLISTKNKYNLHKFNTHHISYKYWAKQKYISIYHYIIFIWMESLFGTNKLIWVWVILRTPPSFQWSHGFDSRH